MVDILVIDDESAVRRLIADTLTTGGYEVREARDGVEGLGFAQERRPDLVICDVNMPTIDGHEVLASLRADPQLSDIPFIFLTGRQDREALRIGMELGADDYITKPFGARELLAAVQSRLQRQAVVAARHETSLRLLRKNIRYALPHELRTPLSLILGYAGLMASDYENLAPDLIREFSETIVKSAERLHRLVENYLVLAQVDIAASDPAELQALRSQITPRAGQVIAQVVREVAEERGRSDEVELELRELALAVPEDDLRKIVREIADNAFKFSEKGGHVFVSCALESSTFTLSISDQGCGMKPDYLAQIGEFMQFDRAVREQQGVGLGLAIVRRLVELHDGQFQIWSQEGLGTTVSITFPC